jgi:hypothetical protein
MLSPSPLLFIVYINDIADKLVSLSRLSHMLSFYVKALSNALEKSQIQNNLLPYSPVNLKCCYKFLIKTNMINK